MTDVITYARDFNESLAGVLERYTLRDDEEGFEPPKDHVELLARTLMFLLREERWMRGGWMKKINHDAYERQAGCGDVACCAMGAMLICTYNGPLIRAFFRGGESQLSSLSGLCAKDPLVSKAVPYVAAAMKARVSRVGYPTALTIVKQGGVSSAVSTVINSNDRSGLTHKDIVAVFSLAHDMARANR